MADVQVVKIPDLGTHVAPQPADVMPIVDVAANVTKKVTIQTLTDTTRLEAVRRSLVISLILGS